MQSTNNIHIGLVQYSPLWEDKQANKDKLLLITGLMDKPVDILVFPEMTLTGFSMKPEKFAENANGETFDFFAKMAIRKTCSVIYGYICKENGNYYNVLTWVDETGTVLSSYRKIHLFSFAGENLHYTKGSGVVIQEHKGLRFGLSICFDLRFPELYRTYAQNKTDVLVNIANWPVSRAMHWNTLLRARAIENQSYVLAVNRTGNDPFVQYPGDSTLIDPLGNIAAHSNQADTIVNALIEKDTIVTTREKFPFLNETQLI
ncbi:MAG: hypothetical protein HYV28_11360 [Ignavibacteriales bacterium]|nr:hypothetical protein [Ignavibacteriales bacterium]